MRTKGLRGEGTQEGSVGRTKEICSMHSVCLQKFKISIKYLTLYYKREVENYVY